MERNLIIARGLPGSGKSTFAEMICNTVISADDFFMKNGKYVFDASKLPLAHQMCQNTVHANMEAGLAKICVANTFTSEWEMAPYFEMAKKYGYRVFTVIVENRHGGTNVHDVPAAVLQKQKDRFNIQL